MRSYIINLPRGLEVDIFDLPENFDKEAVALEKTKEGKKVLDYYYKNETTAQKRIIDGSSLKNGLPFYFTKKSMTY